MLQQHRIARWIKEIKHDPPADPNEKPHVVQHVFKVTPPMEWIEYTVYRRGKKLSDKSRTWMRRFKIDRRTGRERKPGDFLTEKPDPIYSYGRQVHQTSYVIVSASDLKTYMEAANQRMVDLMISKGDKEGEKLFRRSHPFQVETFIFACDKFGSWKDGGELEGSQKGTLDHRVPLRDAGYTVVGMPYNLILLGESVDESKEQPCS